MDGDIQRDFDDEQSACTKPIARPTLGQRISKFFSELSKWEVWKAIFLGQFLAVLLCGTGVSSQYLQSTYKIEIPTAQSFLNYALLCIIFTTWLCCKRAEQNLGFVLKERGWKYFLIAIIDVEANFLLVKAYQYTTLTSVQLLDCFTIPTVLALSWLFLKVRYKIVHILGVGIALLGVGCLVWADTEESRGNSQDATNRFLGDMLCLSGAALYGVSNVAEEYAVKSFSIVEFLGMLGLFGSIVNGVQLQITGVVLVSRLIMVSLCVFLEFLPGLCLKGMKCYRLTGRNVSFIGMFAGCLLMLYITMPVVMQLSSATAVNLSILSADFYSLLIGLYLFNFQFHWLYFVSFSLVIFGVVMFFLQPTPTAATNYREMTASEIQGDLELTNQTPSSTMTYNPFGSVRDDSKTDVRGDCEGPLQVKGATNLYSISHSVSVHAIPEDDVPRIVAGERRNGSTRFMWENEC